MADETTAMVQMISLTMNGTEKVIRGGAAIVKVMAKILWAIFLKVKQRTDLLPGERTMMRFALDGKTLQCLTMNKEQFELFKNNAKQYNIQYHHVNNKRGKGEDLVTVFIPEGDAHKFNRLVNDLKLNSVQNVGTVQAESVHPMKKPDMGTVLAENVDKEGVLNCTELRNNLIKGGMDPDEADLFVGDFLASPEFSAAVDNGKITNLIMPPIEVSKDMIKETVPMETPATEISDKITSFSAEGISSRDWLKDRPLLVDKRSTLAKSLSEPINEEADGFKLAEISRLDRCIELGDKGELTAIEAEPELANTFERTVKPVIVDTAPQITPAIGGAGTKNFAEIVEAPTKLGDVLPGGPDIGPNITLPSPNV